MSKSITQDMAYRQSLMKYAEKYGVSRSGLTAVPTSTPKRNPSSFGICVAQTPTLDSLSYGTG